jgi:CRP/FNR family transcriptional regulator
MIRICQEGNNIMTKSDSEDKISARCRGCRFKSQAVSALDENELELLNRNCIPRNLKRGDKLLIEGKTALYVVYIRNGFVVQFKSQPGQVEQIINIVKTGNYIGLHNIVKHSRVNFISAKALNDVSACFINKECFDELLRRNGEFASRVIACVCENEMFFVDRMMKNRYQQLYGRLAEALLYFRHTVFCENPFLLDMTKSDIASFMGASRESISRAIKEFQDNGTIFVKGKLIHILDEEKLRMLIEKG